MSPNIITQQQKQQYQNNSYSNLRSGGSGSGANNVNGGGSGKVNNLDLLNGCIDDRYDSHAAKSRQPRSRMMYGRNAFNRHETKL